MTFREQLAELTPEESEVRAAALVEVVGARDLPIAWRELDGLWLLWIAATAGVDRRLVVEATCDCVEPVLQHIRAGEPRPRLAVEAARAWCRGERTDAEVERSSRDAFAAQVEAARAGSWQTVALAAAGAAGAASHAVTADYRAEAAADAVAYAARAAGWATLDAYDAERTKYLSRCAALVRARIPLEVVAAALAAKVTP